MMEVAGYLYAATMTNALSEEVPDAYWDEPLISEVGTLRALFKHLIRVRNVYRESLDTGTVIFPGDRSLEPRRLLPELKLSAERLADSFQHTTLQSVMMGGEVLTTAELLSTAVQHEGIHQGQFYVALKQRSLQIPTCWAQDWTM